MHPTTAFDRRETLSDGDLERLRQALAYEVQRYRDAIRGYSPEKMAQYGALYLAELQARVDDVERLLALRGS